jgi:hypothetical protein
LVVSLLALAPYDLALAALWMPFVGYVTTRVIRLNYQ